MGIKAGKIAREFDVETDFQKAAKRPGGVPRAEAIKQAEANIEKIKPSFAAWLDDEINALLQLTDNAKAKHAANEAWIKELGRYSNRLIDVAHTMDYPFLSFVAMNLRTICEAVQDGAALDDEIIACHVNALVLGRHPKYRKMSSDDLPELSEGLRRIVRTKKM